MKRLLVGATAALLSLTVVLAPSFAQSLPSFLETFAGTPAAPAAYTNPDNWDVFVQGFDSQEAATGSTIAQHGPNCEPPGFPYTAANSHVIQSAADAVFICNGHLMTSPGLAGYSAIYMTPPAVMDFSGGSSVLSWDMSTLRTSARDWVDVTLTPWAEHSEMAYNNNDQHIPPDNIHLMLAGGGNVFLVTQRTNGSLTYTSTSEDTAVTGDVSTSWDQVFAQVGLQESPARRDQFEVRLTETTISVCMPGYQRPQGGVFCWVNGPLPHPLDPAIWHDQASVMFGHRVYNAEKACIDTQLPPPANPLDALNIDHTPYGDLTCPPDTWHWSNVSIQPFLAAPIVQPTTAGFEQDTASSTAVAFAQPAPAGSYLSFVQFGHTPDLRVSFDGGQTWTVPRIQPANAPNNGASEENGEVVFTSVPTGVQSVMVRGTNGGWGSFQAEDFALFVPPTSVVVPATPIPATVVPVIPTATVVVARDTPTAQPTPTALPTATSTPVACQVQVTIDGVGRPPVSC